MSLKARVRFTKLGKIRFTSHRDVARIWERALRRADVPVRYTEGFSPRPRLSFGLALPTGSESLGEYVDLDLDPSGIADEAGLEQLPALLDPALPVGMEVQAVAALPAGATSLQQAVTSCCWRIELPTAGDLEAGDAVARALAAAELPLTRERKGSTITDDVRPAILSLAVVASGPVELEAELATQPRGLRPGELVEVVLPDVPVGRMLRTHQWTLVDGARREPLELLAGAGATSTAHAEGVS